MTTRITDFNYKDCEKIDGRQVNAYVDAHLNKENPVELDIETTWGDSAVDLTDAVKAAETVTKMELGSNAISYIAEDGHVDCIYGDDLSRIISLHLLKDVDQTTPPADGDVYIYDGNKEQFVTFNLKTFMNNLSDNLTNINALLNSLRSRAVTLEEKTTPPDNVPDGVNIAFGNINNYADSTANDLKTSGIYTHDPTIDKTNDEFFE